MLKYIYNLATDKSSGFLPDLNKFILFLLSIVYGVIIRTISFFLGLKLWQAKCKVISVGNITLGGTGKTPLVEYLAKALKLKNKKVAVITRGYRKTAKLKSGDEALMLEENLRDVPVIVDKDRIRAINRACSKYGIDLVILDDGFQQWKVKKDLDVVVIDATNPFGNKHMIPRGILREPLSALARADVFMLTKVDLTDQAPQIKSFINKINRRALIFESVHEAASFTKFSQKAQNIDKGYFSSKKVVLISGIGDPDSFEKTIRGLGVLVEHHFKFGDHYQYTQADLEKISRELKNKDIAAVITTVKDAVKLKGLDLKVLEKEVFVLEIRIKIIKDEERLFNRLFGLCGN